jgi:hypothetical protein
MNTIRREKTILDALAERISVYRIAEVAIGIAVISAQRRCGHAQLKRRLEVTQDLAPVALILGAAAMALIDDDQVEEILGVFLVKSGAPLVLGDGLVNREIHLAPLVDFAVLNLPSSITEGGEHLVLRVIDQNISVGEIKNLRTAVLARPVPAHVPKLPTDLKCHGGFPGSRRHGKQDSLLALQHSLNNPVDGDFLM